MDPSIKKICFDFFSGKTDPESADRIERFLGEDPRGKELFRQWEEEWFQGDVPTFSQLNSFSKIKSDIKARRTRAILRWGSAAAAVVLLVVGWLALRPAPKPSGDAEQMLCIVETGFREKTKVILPDSTQVWLNSASRISYNKDFLAGDRVVDLQGEAFFDVKKYPGRGFTVNLGGQQIKVLGTKFNVSSYRKEELCEVSLMEGSIEFLTPGANVEMTPGEILILNTLSNEMEKIRGDVRKDISWMSGKLDYTKITLGRLLGRLSSIYGVDIQYTPGPHGDDTFGVILNLDEPLANILDGLSLIRPVRWNENADGSISVTESY